ncbi:hypothetical protein IFM89_036393 [Coptis chinensis]|uniref:Protein BIG GRAIN 1-like A n=1 Tax=Coptis chinensis TaxID=261450 RepID=A0A835IJA9_9MAGN|nr:hypothetical protein IFM89_036393 [Coptis chinensis]
MDQWTKSLREDKFRHRSKNPSFSSTLLDSIYRSIDEGEEELVLTMKKKQTSSTTTTSTTLKKKDEMNDDYRRACLIEKWMEKKVTEKVVVRRNSAPDFTQNARSNIGFHSASSSSDSSSAGGFSSSEAESLYGSQRPKPIRTSLSAKPEKFERVSHHEHRRSSNEYMHHFQNDRSSIPQKPKHEGSGFNKTKLKAMKIYGDLKKVRQPISPGGKLASFLNSLFTPGTTRKAKMSTSVNGIEDLRSAQASTCSSASSFSRSCLSKTPSSRGKSSNGMKRSVHFYPVSVIVDEDSRPCGHKSLYQEQPKVISLNEELKFHIMEKNRKIEEAAREFLKGYQEKKKMNDFPMRDAHRDYQDDDLDDDDLDDDDAESYASSDLFELDNFAAIGIERYREELPVYETTHLEKNRAISNGYIL